MKTQTNVFRPLPTSMKLVKLHSGSINLSFVFRETRDDALESEKVEVEIAAFFDDEITAINFLENLINKSKFMQNKLLEDGFVVAGDGLDEMDKEE
jgi:malic enzyme